MKKLEERNVCISNAKQRWNFLKKTTLAASKWEKVKHGAGDKDESLDLPPKIISHFQDGEENSDGDLSSSMMTTATETDCTISPTISHQHLHSLSRQTSKSSLLSMKLTLPNSGPGSPSSSSQRSIGYSYKSGSDSEQGNKNHHVPPMTYYVSGFSPWGNFSDLVSLRGHSQITLTKICLFFTPYLPPLVDIR